MPTTYRLLTACPDRSGIVARVTSFIANYNCSISDASHHSDHASGWFFARYEIQADSFPLDLETFRKAFGPIATEFGMRWRIADSSQKKRVIVMASKQSHCIADLLHRWHRGELDCEIPCVISNHESLRSMVEWHQIPFHCVPIGRDNKEAAFEEIQSLVDAACATSIVLARYMQILPPELCERFPADIINIHHSFLPSFVGAKPYHQASARGVKLIGATCHYVTAELDAGPIIEQDVVRISHRDQIGDMVRKGKDCEMVVLARGVRAHLEDRVLVHGNKTVVFD